MSGKYRDPNDPDVNGVARFAAGVILAVASVLAGIGLVTVLWLLSL